MEDFEKTNGQKCVDSAIGTAEVVAKMEGRLEVWFKSIESKLTNVCTRQTANELAIAALQVFNAEHKDKIMKVAVLETDVISIKQNCAAIQSGKAATEATKKENISFVDRYQTVIGAVLGAVLAVVLTNIGIHLIWK